MKKTFSFALMHFSVAFGVAYILTGSVVVGGLVALVEPAVNTVAFYFHERLWQRLETRTLRLSDSADVAIDASRSTPLVA
ncbi:DUF2061 domain-containing protein [Spongiibacter nanhainus]|uniref:DUF2061 domain-containing protein n=1 Tax=Spongiibacter nanhainus TaxID=2794344 RepID=A0A7T4QY86_9GAMM|nr:DUF2061 domain-containing protein [Spongiibacter nanhainus]QQD16995.1 DUF2061 domain-containing protein [Spongiibacter nanhainus]